MNITTDPTNFKRIKRKYYEKHYANKFYNSYDINKFNCPTNLKPKTQDDNRNSEQFYTYEKN